MQITFTPETWIALAIACALAVALIGFVALPAVTRNARMRAQERARAWAALRAPEWQERAERKRAQRASGAHAEARLRRALMSAVALVALAATNLSAHATINAMARVGLHSIDTAVSVIVVFEMFLAILGALSWWHMNRGSGFNRYELGVWLMASLMGGIAWWGGGSPIFALWPLLAAVAWHVVVTFGREHKTAAVVTWWRLKRGKATSRDASAVMTERFITRIVNHAYAANEGARALRKARKRAFDRAWAQADALGILTPEVRARIQTRLAARYAGVSALAPDAVAHMNPWSERASAQRAPRIARPVSAPPAHAHEESAHVPDDARALIESAHEERASESAPARMPRTAARIAHSKAQLLEALDAHFGTDNPMHLNWAKEFVKANGQLPTRTDLARYSQLSPGNCAKWIAPVNKALKA